MGVGLSGCGIGYCGSLVDKGVCAEVTDQCSTSKIYSSNSYLTSTLIHNDTPSDNFINTTYEVDVPSIDNEG